MVHMVEDVLLNENPPTPNYRVVRHVGTQTPTVAYTVTLSHAERIVKALDTDTQHAEIYRRVRRAMMANDELFFDRLIAALDATPRGTARAIDAAFLKVMNDG